MYQSDWFRGNWNLPWVAHRYLRTFRAGISAGKLLNASAALSEMLWGRAKVSSLPFVLRLEPTSTCNLSCPRCSTGLGIDPRPRGFISFDDVEYLIDTLRSYVVFVRLDGAGEPLLHPKIVEIISAFKEASIAVTLSTHLNTPPRGGMRALVDSGVDRLVVAVDGATQETYERYRVGGRLELVLENLHALAEARGKARKPEVDLQFLDWGYNSDEIGAMQRIAKETRCDRLTVIRPDWAEHNAKANRRRPKRCFWLWTVLTVDWRLEYRSCTNAWTLPFPRLNARTTPPKAYWNCAPLVSAREFNAGNATPSIEEDLGCLCRRCTDMLVADRPEGYVCE